MLKGILAGLVAGALATACVLKVIASHRVENATDPGSATVGTPADPAALKTQADGLRASNAGLKKEIDQRGVEIAALEVKEVPGNGKKPRKKAGDKTWKELAPFLLKAFGGGEEGDEKDQKAAQAAQLDFMALLARIAKQRGLTMDEAMSAPEGLPQLLRAMLEIGTPPATPEQLAQIDGLIATYTKDWTRIHDAAGDMTRLEQRLATGELADGYQAGLIDTMTSEQKSSSKAMDMFGMMGDGMGGGGHYSNGTRETVAADIGADWAKALKLDELQKKQLAPFVEQYMNDYLGAASKFRDESQSGDKAAWKKIQREQFRAQIKAQQALAAGLSLSPAQAKALHDWSTTYGFFINSDPVAPEPTGDPTPK